MKYLLFLLFLTPLFTFAQPCADEDTVRNNAATLITANTARINGTTGHFSPSVVLSLQLRYVRVGFTDTATASASGTNPLRNLSGLQPSTTYRYYYTSVCGSGAPERQNGVYTFTTLAATVVYATERSTVFQYLKSDSGLVVPRIDTLLYKQPSTTGGNIVFNPADSVFYGYNKQRWVPLMNSSSGISNKVDSVTVASDSLFYWINGVAYGYILPTARGYLTGTVGGSGANDPTAGTSLFTSSDLVGLGANIVITVNNVQYSNYGAGANIAFTPGTGTINIAPNVWITGAYLSINLNQ